MPPFAVKVGEKYNRLKIIEFSHIDKWRIAYWKCVCDCGNICIVAGSKMKSQSTKSCGCYRREVESKQNSIHTRMSRVTENSVYALLEKSLYISYKKRHETKNPNEIFLEKEKFLELIKKNCHYCDSPPQNEKILDSNSKQISYNKFSYIKLIYNGLDRVNNEIGYTVDNIVPCCIVCNKMKSAMNVEDFYAHINKIINFKGKL